MNNYDRALVELLKIKNPINEVNCLLYKTLLGLALGKCLYYELSVYSLCEAFYILKPLVDQYRIDDNLNTDVLNKKKAADFKKKIPESIILY
jgi:hypothetical protein